MHLSKLKSVFAGISLVVLVTIVLSGVVQGNASAAANDAASITCINLGKTGALLTPCETGYAEGLARPNGGGLGNCGGLGQAGPNYDSCLAGVKAGAAAGLNTNNAGNSACAKYSNNPYNASFIGNNQNGSFIACNYAFTLGEQGQGSDYCKNIQAANVNNGAVIVEACKTGYNASAAASTAGVACTNLKFTTNSQFKACVNGWNGASRDGAATTACNNYTGADKAACTAGSGAGAGTATAVTSSSGPTSTSTAQQTATIGLTCNVDLNPLTWLICPIVDAANAMVGYLDTQITSLLDINGCQYFNPTSSPNNINTIPANGQSCSGNGNPESEGYYLAWQNLRTIAIGIVVIAALIMVISQALGFEVFDAYTIKKVLPRMIIAVIGIALSWELVQLMVQISNDLGVGIRYLIYAPFVGLAKNGGITINQTGSSALAIISGVSLLGLGLIGLLSFALTAALAVIIGFALLTFRQIFIVFMAIFAPIAIACFILPGTQKVWKFWWENFSKALIMFPIIAGFIAIGRVFALSATGPNVQGAGAVQQVTAMVAYFGPYFLIPLTFRMAGGILSNVGGMVGGLQRSINKPLGQFRRNKLSQNAAALKQGERFHGRDYIPGSNRLSNRLNTVSRGVGQGFGGSFGLGVRGNSADNQTTIKRGAEIMKSENFQAIANHEEALRAGTYGSAAEARAALTSRYNADGTDPDKVPGRVNDAIRSWQAAGFGWGAGEKGASYAAAQQLVTTGTGYEDMKDMTETLDRSAKGNMSTKTSLAGFANSRAKEVGRYDLAPGFGSLNKLVTADAGERDYDQANLDAAQAADPVTALRGKPKQVKNITETLSKHLGKSISTWQDTSKPQADREAALHDAIRTVGQMSQYDTQKGYASPLNQQHVNNMINGSASNSKIIRDIAEQDPEGLGRMLRRAEAPPQRSNDPYDTTGGGGRADIDA